MHRYSLIFLPQRPWSSWQTSFQYPKVGPPVKGSSIFDSFDILRLPCNCHCQLRPALTESGVLLVINFATLAVAMNGKLAFEWGSRDAHAAWSFLRRLWQEEACVCSSAGPAGGQMLKCQQWLLRTAGAPAALHHGRSRDFGLGKEQSTTVTQWRDLQKGENLHLHWLNAADGGIHIP